MPTRPSRSTIDSLYGSPLAASQASPSSRLSLYASPITGTTLAFARSIRSGCSTRHDTHQDAHTLSSHTWPRMSAVVSVLPGSCSCASANAGAGLPISGDGTSRGSRNSPTNRNATMTVKMASGSDQRRKRSRGHFGGVLAAGAARLRSAGVLMSASRTRDGRTCAAEPLAHGEPITPVHDGEESAERHQQASAPDPVDEGLRIDAHAPRAVVADRLAERNVAIAEEAGLDRRFGHHLAGRAVRAFLRREYRDRAAVARHVDRRDRRVVVRPGPRGDAAERVRVAGHFDALSDVQAHVALDLVALHERDTGDERGDAEMREQHAVPGGRVRAQLVDEVSLRRAAQPLD